MNAVPVFDTDPERDAERARQQALLAALWPSEKAPPDEMPAGLASHLRSDRLDAARGLRAYRINAAATAERALATTFPVLRALIGADDFVRMARASWRAVPPGRGDLAWAGADLPDFVAADPNLAEVPYLGDVARLEWQVAQTEAAADPALAPDAGLASLRLLVDADVDPAALRLRLAPGAALLRSPWPVATLWNAHRSHATPEDPAAVRLDSALAEEARAKLRAGTGEVAWIWRDGWTARVAAVDAPTANFLAALIDGRSLGAALDEVFAQAPGWAFDAWLHRALAERSLLGAEVRAFEIQPREDR